MLRIKVGMQFQKLFQLIVQQQKHAVDHNQRSICVNFSVMNQTQIPKSINGYYENYETRSIFFLPNKQIVQNKIIYDQKIIF